MRSVACKNDNSAWLHFLIRSLDSYFYSFLDHNFTTIRNISMVLARFIELVSVECIMQEYNSALLHFLVISPYPYFNSFPEHNSEPLEIFQ